MFEIIARDSESSARLGLLHTAHGAVETPAFMPVGTYGAVKTMTPRDLEGVGARIILSNAYHLSVRPGADLIERSGGLHRFMGWSGPILTDSGGYQVFSLSARRKIRDDGVEFASHFDGRTLFMGPAEAMAIQRALASDIAMVFDDCAPFPCDYENACKSVDRTLRWAASCAEQPRADGQRVFGIVQGSSYPDLRERCAQALVKLGFDGYAVGGVSVGEPEKELLEAAAVSVAHLPVGKPRYLMGVGLMHQMVEAVAMGVDLFDCVVPTRFARNGSAFTRMGVYPVKAAVYKEDFSPIEEGCGCYVCSKFSRAYVRHLLNIGEMLGHNLLTFHNLFRYMEFMRELRLSIANGTFSEFRKNCCSRKFNQKKEAT